VTSSTTLARITPSYYVDRFEFPNRIKSEDGKAIRPSLKMTAADAQAQCERIGKRLWQKPKSLSMQVCKVLNTGWTSAATCH
jgi:hypothetical protein